MKTQFTDFPHVSQESDNIATAYKKGVKVDFNVLNEGSIVKVICHKNRSLIGVLCRVDVPRHMLTGHFEEDGEITYVEIPIVHINQVHQLVGYEILQIIQNQSNEIKRLESCS